MENIDRLKDMIQYIEQNLTCNIEYKKLAEILCVNEYTLHRIFYFITNISLSEYIRKRRLSRAALELKENSEIKIVDLAIKYQYDSATSFSRAFLKMQGFKPSEMSLHNSYIKNYPMLDFKLGFSKEIEINVRMENLPAQQFYGVCIECAVNDIKNKAPAFWEKFNANHKYMEILKDTTYGIIKYDEKFPNPENATYYIASEKQFESSIPIIIPSSKWAIFQLEETNGEYISKYSNNIWYNWVPYSGYNVLPIPEIEKYHKDGKTEWYLSIE